MKQFQEYYSFSNSVLGDYIAINSRAKEINSQKMSIYIQQWLQLLIHWNPDTNKTYLTQFLVCC